MEKEDIVPDVYVCSKPLQYFNIKNIPEIDGHSSRKVLIVNPEFSNGREFIELVRVNDKEWDEVIDMNGKCNYYNYLRTHKINFLFVENDASYKMSLFMLVSKVKRTVHKLFVFEEGIGTYRGDLHFGVDKLIRKLLLLGDHYGSSIFSDNVIVYEPNFYNTKHHSNKAISFARSFVDGLKKNKSLLMSVCDSLPPELDVRGKKILLYITNHSIDYDIVKKMVNEKDDYDLLFIKPHPHIKSLDCLPTDLTVIKTNLMVEYILFNLMESYNDVTVWHQASTSVVYFIDSIKSANFTSFPIFDEFVDYRQSNNKI